MISRPSFGTRGRPGVTAVGEGQGSVPKPTLPATAGLGRQPAPESGWAPFAPFREDVLVAGEHPAWEAAPRADPDVRAFLDGG
jgi:hypothetical protein